MKPFQVGLLGAGTVGGGTFAVLQRNQEEIRRRAGREIRIAHVVDVDLARARGVACDTARPREVDVDDKRDPDLAAGAAPDLFLVALQDREGAAADDSGAEQADLERLHAKDGWLPDLAAWRAR